MQRRWKLSSAQRADMWSRWKAGQSLHAIGRALGKDKQVIHFLLARHGGIAPPVRRRSRRALTLAEREDISRGIASGGLLRRSERTSITNKFSNGRQEGYITVGMYEDHTPGRDLYQNQNGERRLNMAVGPGHRVVSREKT